MAESKTTKRALAASIGCMALCVVLLIGTTFAWFTDTASTSVNKIQSGTLDVAIVDPSGTELTGGLTFQKASGHDAEAVLWEPGCTYTTNEFCVKNNGSLALKYKLSIDGVDGDAGLLSAIDFSVVDSAGTDVDLSTFEGNLTGKDTDGCKSGAYKIRAHMKESAGNEYQGLELDGVKVSVTATQDTVEHDSASNEYDKNAIYPVASAAELETALTNAQDGDVVVLSDAVEISSSDYDVDKRLHVAADNVTLDLNGQELTAPNYTLTVTGSNVTVKNGTINSAVNTNRPSGYDSYAIALSGTNVTLDGVTTRGGVSVTSYDDADEEDIHQNVSATIKNCEITATNYYTVCAQGKAAATVMNSKLICGEKSVAFFWIENKDCSISYQESTVTFDPALSDGGKALYLKGTNYGVPTAF